MKNSKPIDLANIKIVQKSIPNEACLIIALKNKDRKAFELLYDNYSAALLGVILKIVRQKELAEDILIEAFCKISKSFDQYDASKGRLFTWLINVARNLSLDKLRSRDYKNGKNLCDLSNEMEAVNADHQVVINPAIADVRQLASKLEDNYKILIDLAYFKGFTQVEISEILQIPIGTVKTRMRKAIHNLRMVFDYDQAS